AATARPRRAARACGCGGGAVSEACGDLVRDLAGRDDVQEYPRGRPGRGGEAYPAVDAGVCSSSVAEQTSRIGSWLIGSARCSLVGDRGASFHGRRFTGDTSSTRCATPPLRMSTYAALTADTRVTEHDVWAPGRR